MSKDKPVKIEVKRDVHGELIVLKAVRKFDSISETIRYLLEQDKLSKTKK